MELEQGPSLDRAKLPEYVSHVLTEIAMLLKAYFGSFETMHFIDTTLILHEFVLKTFQPLSIGVLINCDFFEQLTTQNFESYDYQSLYEIDCKAHQWVPRKYNIIPVKRNDDHWMLFHGNFDEDK